MSRKKLITLQSTNEQHSSNIFQHQPYP